MKKLFAILAMSVFGFVVMAPAYAAPVGGGYGNQCQVPAVNSWCWLRTPQPLGSGCLCDASGTYPGFTF